MTWKVTEESEPDRSDDLLAAIAADPRIPNRLIADWLLAADTPKLAVLAPAGAGKTCASLHIARELVRDLQKSHHVVPVVLSASSLAAANFDPVQAAETFLRSALGESRSDLGALVRDHYDRGALAFVVDGLDEVARDARIRLIRTVDRMPRRTVVVLTSRPAEYREAINLVSSVHDIVAVELGTAPFHEIRAYLERGAISKAGQRRKAQSTWSATLDALQAGPLTRQADAVRTVLSVPLYAWLARERYRTDGPDPDELLDPERLPTQDSIKGLLLDGLIPAKYEGVTGDRVDMLRRWYTHLARRFGATWPPLDHLLQLTEYPRATHVVPAVVAGLVACLSVLLTAQPPATGLFIIVLAVVGAPLLAFAIDAARMFVNSEEATPPRALRKHSREASIGAAGGVIGGAALGLLLQPLDLAAHGLALAVPCVALATLLLCHEVVDGIAPFHVPLALATASGAAAAANLGALSAVVVVAGALGLIGAVGAARGERYTPIARLLRGAFFFVLFASSYAAVGGALVLLSSVVPPSIATTGGLIALACVLADVVARKIAGADGTAIVSVPVTLLVIGLVALSETPVNAAVVLGTVMSLGAVAGSQWGQYRLSHWWAALHGRLPWRLERLLREGVTSGLLSATGTNYLFRHSDLRERLVERDEAARAAQEGRRPADISSGDEDVDEAPRPEPDSWQPEPMPVWILERAVRHLRRTGFDLATLAHDQRTVDAIRTLARSGVPEIMGALGLALVHAAESPSEADTARAMRGVLRMNIHFAKLEQQHEEGVLWLRRAIRFGGRDNPMFEAVSVVLVARHAALDG